MITHSFAKQQVYDITRLNSQDVIVVYKPTSDTTDIYREGDITYDEGTEVVCIVRTAPDENMSYILGKVEKDKILVTIPLLELENKFVTSPFITTRDKFTFEGMTYTIDEVKRTGRVGGDYTSVVLCARENPDE